MIIHKKNLMVKPRSKAFDVFLSKKFRLAVFLAVLLFLFFTYRKISIYILFIGLTAIIIYYSKLYHLPIDISPLFFLEIVITRYYGFQFTLLYVLLAYIVPKTFAGQNMKFDSYVFIAISMVANILVLVFPGMPLMTVGFLTSVIQYFMGIMFSMTMKPFALAALDGFANVANNLVYFLIFSDLVVWILA
jgi:hypothetical protein